MVQKFPKSAILFNIQGAILKGLRQLDLSIEIYNKALAIKPDYTETYDNMGNTLKERGKLEEAIQAYSKALALKPDYADVYYNVGITLKEQDKLEEAIEAFKKDNSTKIQTSLLKCLFGQNSLADFYGQLDDLIDRGENNAVIGSHISRSKIKYGIARKNPFCNEPLKYVLHTNLTDNCDFENIFVKAATDIFKKDIVRNRTQNLLTNGVQMSQTYFYI